MMDVSKEDETKELKRHDHHSTLTGTESVGKTCGDSDGWHDDFSETVPTLGTTVASKNFGKKLAAYGRMGPWKRRQIRQGWNKVVFLLLLLVIGAFGGNSKSYKRKKTTDFNNILSPRKQNFEAHRDRDREVPYHFVSRLSAFFQLGGTIQRISDEKGIGRNDVVKGGASRYQDCSSGKGKQGIHAAHVVRLGEINSNLPEYLRKELEDLLGHTQNVPKYANQGGIGRAVDNFQSGEALKELNKIDFSDQMTNKDLEIIKHIKNRYKRLFDKIVSKRWYKQLNEQEKRELQKAGDGIDSMEPQALYDIGHAAYQNKMKINGMGKTKQAKYEGYGKTSRRLVFEEKYLR